MDTIKLPIEYDINGFRHITDGTDEFYKQLLSISSRTEPGVQPIFPEFGVADPTFNSNDRGKFLIMASRYVPEIRLLGLDINQSDSSQLVTFTFTRR
jgi:hypothetical protein